MKVFISWSGQRSRIVAESLRDCLKDVIQALEPWISSADIDKGARWRSEISARLEECQVGIICLTRDNMEAPWLLFEAGALSKVQHASYVCTLLLDIAPNEVREPLGQFQGTRLQKEDVFQLISTINNLMGEGASLSERQLERAFNRVWPDFEEELNKVSRKGIEEQPAPDVPKMLEEVLGYVRTFSREEAESKQSRTSTLLGVTSDEIIVLGKILATNKHLSIVAVNESIVEFSDGTHGTVYKVNRRALSTFLQKLRKAAREHNRKKPE